MFNLWISCLNKWLKCIKRWDSKKHAKASIDTQRWNTFNQSSSCIKFLKFLFSAEPGWLKNQCWCYCDRPQKITRHFPLRKIILYAPIESASLTLSQRCIERGIGRAGEKFHINMPVEESAGGRQWGAKIKLQTQLSVSTEIIWIIWFWIICDFCAPSLTINTKSSTHLASSEGTGWCCAPKPFMIFLEVKMNLNWMCMALGGNQVKKSEQHKRSVQLGRVISICTMLSFKVIAHWQFVGALWCHLLMRWTFFKAQQDIWWLWVMYKAVLLASLSEQWLTIRSSIFWWSVGIKQVA